MTPQGKYQRLILAKGFVQVTEVNDPNSFFPLISLYDNKGKCLVFVDSSDDTASNFLYALKKFVADGFSQLSNDPDQICSINGGTGVYFNLWHKDGQLMIVNRDVLVNTDHAIVLISKEDAIGLIAAIVALH